MDTVKQLFVVFLDTPLDEKALNGMDITPLSGGLWLVRTALTQSKLYHLVKRVAKPDALFVGRLDEPPKFKGMAAGSLKWLRMAG